MAAAICPAAKHWLCLHATQIEPIAFAALGLTVILMSAILARRLWPLRCNFPENPISEQNLWMGARVYNKKRVQRDAAGEATPIEDEAVAGNAGEHNVNFTGRVGELLTSVLLVTKGARQLPSQPSWPRGIDGVYYKERTWPFGPTIYLAETKASQISLDRALKGYDSVQMSVTKLTEQLDNLKQGACRKDFIWLDDITQSSLSNGLRANSIYIRRHLFLHDLKLGITEIYPLDRHGKLIKWRKVRRNSKDHKYLLEALGISLGRIARSIDGELFDKNSVALTGGELPNN